MQGTVGYLVTYILNNTVEFQKEVSEWVKYDSDYTIQRIVYFEVEDD